MFISAFKLTAQTYVAPCFRDSFCTYRLCDTCTVPFPVTAKDILINYGKYNQSATYPGDVTYKDENDDCKHLSLSGYATCTTSDNGKLFYDVYYPVSHDYTNCPLPCVMYVHGGGFSDCSAIGHNSDIGKWLAQRGFVCFVIEYRAGRRITPIQGLYPYTTVQQELAGYQAGQDARGALRTIIQRQREQFALPLNQRKPY